MDTTMELDEFKQAWQTLDRRLEQQNRMSQLLFREHQGDKARSGLRPLVWGQIAQIVFGALLALLGGSFWTAHLDAFHLFLCGAVVHAYGIALIVIGARTLLLVRSVDYSAPVLDIQKRLAQLRAFYIRGGLTVGLAWWLLWIPLLTMLFMGVSGVDLYAKAPQLIWGGTGVGVAGLLLTWWFYRWSRSPDRPRLQRAMEASVIGGSLRRAQKALDEIADFERA